MIYEKSTAYDHTENNPKSPIDWMKVIYLIIGFGLLLIAGIWQISL